MDGAKLDDWLLSPWAWLEDEAEAQPSRRKARTERASNDGDTLNGTAEDDVFFGGRGDDLLRGRGGDDRLIGRAGDDRLIGGGGNDSLVGSAGEDLLKGGGGADTMKGGGRADDLRGGGGNDSLLGGGGGDRLNGGGGSDLVDGGGGADTLFGNRGSDTLKVGRGADVFQFAARDLSGGAIDTIADLGRGADRIDISRFSGVAALSQLNFGMLDGDVTIDIGAGWTAAGTEEIDGKTFDVFTQGNATIKIFTEANQQLTGDLNNDGFVGIADLNIILGNWNQNVTPGSLPDGARHDDSSSAR